MHINGIELFTLNTETGAIGALISKRWLHRVLTMPVPKNDKLGVMYPLATIVSGAVIPILIYMYPTSVEIDYIVPTSMVDYNPLTLDEVVDEISTHVSTTVGGDDITVTLTDTVDSKIEDVIVIIDDIAMGHDIATVLH